MRKLLFIALAAISLTACKKKILRSADFTWNEIYTSPGDVQFTDLSTNPDSYLWDFGDGVISNLKSPKHTYSYNGSFVVTLDVGAETKAVKTVTISH